jgi:uncharacterized protein (TIGR03118 family)
MLKRTRDLIVLTASLLLLLPAAALAAPPKTYTVTPLVSDQPGVAPFLDPNLVNAWGLVAGPTTPWWVADADADVSTLYGGDGTPRSLVVSVEGGPTGLVFNGGSGFVVTDGTASGPALFLWATESGTIRGWNPAVPPPAPSTQSFVGADRSAEDANYKGLAIASTTAGDFLYAADFHNARIDMFDSDFDVVTPAGAFVDPGMPAGFAPFGIQNIRGTLFVTYAMQDAAAEDEVTGPGLGFVDAFTTNGTFLARVASGGSLNAPWGLALAPPSFGKFAGDLLVGNFGDGRINAYGRGKTALKFGFAGQLQSSAGGFVEIDGLWALQFGNDAAAGPSSTLFFTAGPDDEEHGLFGSIVPS